MPSMNKYMAKVVFKDFSITYSRSELESSDAFALV